ncbi:hypothetical protein S40288_04504 [Stachybotrys chartarum IBT 40288]|nr:hypothetical protein S40288_04504 [Stachybotrys chartarum IBT 40288]
MAAVDKAMFHTFQVEGMTCQQQSIESDSAADKPKITHACTECKRRKTRCDGQQPCRQCLSGPAKRCVYEKRRPRIITSRRTVEGLSKSLEECHSILRRLYPGRRVSDLLPLTRHELLELLDHTPDEEASHVVTSPSEASQILELGSQSSIAGLEQIPSGDVEWDEERRDHDPIPAEADDVNALSLAVDKQASYLGASSIKAAFVVLLKTEPRLKDLLKLPSQLEARKSMPVLGHSHTHKNHSPVRVTGKGQSLIDSYFKRVHILIPMLDEKSFRDEYLREQRTDSPWLALLNTVMALGSIAASKSTELSHVKYYNKAMDYLALDALGSSRIETVQALAIIGGLYLHYVNRPNMANALLGAAMRMACALGLHREFPSHSRSSIDLRAAEIRRRTWWSLFSLDTWATTTMGRPSLGRMGQAINVQPPELGMDQALDSLSCAGILPFIETIKFCKIATRIQDALAITPLLGPKDRQELDLQLQNWHKSLPWLLESTSPCAEPLYIARCVMRWRYQNLRVLLHRPVLLTMASINREYSEEDKAAVEICQTAALRSIKDICEEWTRTQMLGWNGAWFLYQATMIPLVSMFHSPDSPHLNEWQSAIEQALESLDAMEDWSITASRSRDVVRRIYNLGLERSTMWPGDKAAVDFAFPQSEGQDITAMFDHDWNWDLDEMFLSESTSLPGFDVDQFSYGMVGSNDGLSVDPFSQSMYPGYSEYFEM